MSKIMVVEDDVALREIYSIRITAEGYDVVTAGDGEEALAVAVREKPDLILSDVMMPKISGFDMLDILRNTPETANIHVIMMTALSADDQRNRGERLGCDKYLVKSQVGIEDVVNAIHEVLGDQATPAPTSQAAVPAASPVPQVSAPVVSPTPQPFVVAPKSQTAQPDLGFQPTPQPAPQSIPQPAPQSTPQPGLQVENGGNPAQ